MTRTLDQWLAWQESLHPKTIELGLGRVCDVATRLRLPNVRCRTLTIAGTNGKGSSATLAANIYRCAGYRVGLYTSPHLQRYNERIAVDGLAVSDTDICRAFEAIEAARGDISLTYFEFGTLAALWLFREAQVDVQVLEVGLGGRLDAVNLVDADAMLITNIGLDHLDWLGPDRESIGREKAGILRAQRPAIYADPMPVSSVREAARQLSAPMWVLNEDFGYRCDDDTWNWRGKAGAVTALPYPGLKGEAQVRNAAGVLAAIEATQPVLPVTETAIRHAMPELCLRGRYQRLGQVIVDVAHNLESAQVLTEQLKQEKVRGNVYLILAMLSDKPVEATASLLAPLFCEVCVAGLLGARGLTGEQMQQRLAQIGIASTTYPDVATAIETVRLRMCSDDLLVVTGSFLTVAAALDTLDE